MRISARRACWLLILALVLADIPARAQSVITPERLLADYASPLMNIPEIDWTPDGSALVFAAEARRVRACTPNNHGAAPDGAAISIVVLDARSGTCRIVALGRKPRVAPDGKRLAFVAGSEAEARLAIVSLNGDAPRDLTQKSAGLAGYYSDFAWAQDGSAIVYGFRPEPPKPALPAHAADSTVRVIGGAGDLPPDSEMWVVSIDTGKRRKILHEAALFTDLSWFPDGRSVLFMARGSLEYRTDGFTAEVRAVEVTTAAVRTIVKDAGVQRLSPVLSPDGRQIAFLYDQTNLYYPSYNRVATISAAGGRITPLTDDLWVRGQPRWPPDSDAVFFRGKPAAFTQIYRVADGGQPQPITRSPREVHNFALSPDGRMLAWIALDAYGRMEARTARADGADERVLFDFTPEIATLRLAAAEEIRWTSADGLEIVGILVKPLDSEPGRRSPLIVDLHGGPLGGVGLAGRVLLTTPLEWQMWAAKGYAVLHADYRSSGIYGWDKLVAMRDEQDEAARDFDDIMTGVDHVIRLGLADPARLGVIGHSAGGFRTNWIVTHTERFKAAVSYEGVADMFLAYGSGARVGGNVALEWHYNGKPWEVPENYRRGSPIEFVKGVKTPTMFVSGSTGVALFHNEGMYTAWKVQGVPVELLVYDGEGHVISRPPNQRDLLMRVIAWMDRWLK